MNWKIYCLLETYYFTKTSIVSQGPFLCEYHQYLIRVKRLIDKRREEREWRLIHLITGLGIIHHAIVISIPDLSLAPCSDYFPSSVVVHAFVDSTSILLIFTKINIITKLDGSRWCQAKAHCTRLEILCTLSYFPIFFLSVAVSPTFSSKSLWSFYTLGLQIWVAKSCKLNIFHLSWILSQEPWEVSKKV